MYNKEEEKLQDFKKIYDNISVSNDSLDAAIMAGFQKAKQEEIKRPQSRNKWIYSFVAAAVLLLGFFTSVRLSPALADYVAVIPGMEKIVELIRFDKGRLAAIENDHFQEIGVSDEKNGLTVTLDGVITDETGMVLFYSIESAKKQETFFIDEVNLIGQKGEELPISGALYGSPGRSNESDTSFTGTVEYYFKTPLTSKNLEFNLKLDGDGNEEFKFLFTIEKDIKGKKTYELNKSVSIEGQKITFLNATVHPLRVAVHLKMDSANTKKILHFDDLRLVDENGETWNKISSGITGVPISDNEQIIYLQSNYFRHPKELYLALGNLQAIDKEEAFVEVDLEKERILKQPKGNFLSEVKVEGGYVNFTMMTKKEFQNLNFGKIFDRDGKEINSDSFTTSMRDDAGVKEYGIEISNLEKQKGPISIEILSFPSWIEGEAKVRLK
jgi:hypothetical protein